MILSIYYDAIMNPLEYYHRRGERFTESELKELGTRYDEKSSVNELADYFRKTPGQILYWLKKENKISDDVRRAAMNEYTNSSLFTELTLSRQEGKEIRFPKQRLTTEERKQNREERRLRKAQSAVQQAITHYTTTHPQQDSPSTSNQLLLLKDEVRSLKQEVSEMKKDLKEMIRLIHLVYDFETQE